MGKKYAQEEVCDILQKRGYVLCDKYIKNNINISFCDNEGYKYYACLSNVLMEHPPYKFSVSNVYTLDNIKNWIHINNKPFMLISKTYINKSSPLKFKCIKQDCNMEFEASWNNITNRKGCPYCSHTRLRYEFSLDYLNPSLSEEWDYERNYPITPKDIFANSNKKYWWICKNNSSHKIFKSPNYRKDGGRCPKCSNSIAHEEHNLLINNPILCEEWDYEKNTKGPSEFTPYTTKKAHWICKKCGNRWEAGIRERNRGNGCSKCASSKGEEKIRIFLKNYNIKFEEQYSIKKCKNIRTLPFDFAIMNGDDLLMLIEYDGEFHYEESRFKNKRSSLKEVRKRDKIKTDYCENNNILLLRIPYWEFDNIEEILIEGLKLGGN